MFPVIPIIRLFILDFNDVMNKSGKIIFAILFLTVLLVPLIRSFSSVDESTAWMEKRELAKFPKFKILY